MTSHGVVLAIVRSKRGQAGGIRLQASSDTLQGASVPLTSVGAKSPGKPAARLNGA